jgi:hypothetical protein
MCILGLALVIEDGHENPTVCAVQSVIQFLNAKRFHLAEIHRQIVKVCGEGAIEQRKCEEMVSVVQRRQDSVQLHAVVHTHYTDCSSGNFRASSIQS